MAKDLWLAYILNSYFTGLLSYPLDIFDAMAWNEDKFGEIVVKTDGNSPKFNLPDDVLPN